MSDDDLSGLPPEEQAAILRKIPVDLYAAQLPLLSRGQILIFASGLGSDGEESSIALDKALAAIKALPDFSLLEALSAGLSDTLTLALFDDPRLPAAAAGGKISPLFVGMPHETFKKLFFHQTPNQAHILKQEAITEPLQHHITQLAHEIIHAFAGADQGVTAFATEIHELDLAKLGYRELHEVMHSIDDYRNNYNDALGKIQQLLAFAWNSGRSDLIERLGLMKEICIGYIDQVFGKGRHGSEPPTGLYKYLETRMLLTYGDPQDSRDLDAADDDQPAIETIIKFHVWYPQEYWSVGLLPHISDPAKISIATRLERDKMVLQAAENLAKIGLSTAKDLKEAGIFSLKSLQEYIAAHKQRLGSPT